MGQAELTNDEAQYALYGYHLDWSYFDHPPLAGWLNAFILQFSDSDFALRVWPLLLAALTSFLLYQLTQELFPNESPWLATLTLLLYQASVISQAFALAMLPDTPLIPIAIAAIWFLHRALTKNQPHLWIYIGLLFGLAGLAKYTAVTLVFTAVIALYIYRAHNILLTKWPWIAASLAAIVIFPILYWNIQHDWMSINYQLNHGAPDKAWLFKNFFVSQASQLVSYTPIIFVFGLITIIYKLKSTDTSNNEKYILAFSLPVLVLFNWLSGYEPSLPHWTALGWIALMPLIAKWMLQNWNNKALRIFTYLGFSFSFIMAIGLHLLLATSILPFEENKHPLENIYGWKIAANKAVALQSEMQKENQNTQTAIFVGNWSHFSRLAWYAKPARVQVTDGRYGQSDLWYGTPQKGDNGILVVPPKYKDTVTSGRHKFTRCEDKVSASHQLNNKKSATYNFYKCYGYKG